MKKHIVCLGDSNTHGYCAEPADCADGGNRFNENERWPRVMEKLLGKKSFRTFAEEFVFKPEGALTLVPESDKRQAVNPADADFADMTDN